MERTLFFDDLLWNCWFRAVLLHEGNQAFEAYLRWFFPLRSWGMTANHTDDLMQKPPQLAYADEPAQQRIESFLMSRYGPVMDSPVLAEVLRFKTVAALEKSMERGHVSIRCMDTPHRRGRYFLTADVAVYLMAQFAESSTEPQPSEPPARVGRLAGKEHEKTPKH